MESSYQARYGADALRRPAPLLPWLFALVALLVLAAGAGARAAEPTLPALAEAADAGEADSKEALDRQTPRRTMEGFLRETKQGDFRVAASYLDLRGIPAASRDEVGPDLAQKLGFVLERQPTLDVGKIPDVAAGDPIAKPPDTLVADTLYAGEEPVPIALQRVHFPDGVDRWLIAQSTVQRIPIVDAAYGPRPIGVRLPTSLTRPTFLGNELWQWIGLFGASLVAYGVARAFAAIVVHVGKYFAHRTPTQIDDVLVESARRPLRAIAWALGYRVLLGPIQLTSLVVEVIDHVTYTVLVLGVTWLILGGLGAWAILVEERVARDSADGLSGRRVRTQAALLRRVAGVTIGFVSSAVILLQFDLVRNVGVSLLASAGVLGVVVGIAAQRSLGAIIAGIQFSAAQPVRMADQIVVEGEFGEIEEINLTYLVVRLWDKRRLVVPITYFLEKPFQNWTRSETDLVGSILLKVDQAVPVDAVRAELRRICEADPLWDKKTCAVQVTESDAATMTLRAAVSALDATRLWDLRCRVREHLLSFLHREALSRAKAAAPAPSPGGGDAGPSDRGGPKPAPPREPG
jgi:small-conductance mechanosensitive channel